MIPEYEWFPFLSRTTRDVNFIYPTPFEIDSMILNVKRERVRTVDIDKRAKLKVIIAEMKILKQQLF